MESKIIREKFIKFFQKKGHKLLPASSLIPADPSVLLTTAGMQQFKDWFAGKSKAKFKEVVTIQPCFRTSDIELVGDQTHLTFFEMLGNFSFGSYFKEKAIKLAYEFITQELKISKEKITVTIFPGDNKKNLPLDNESLNAWQKIIPTQKILMGDTEDNFWGPTGDEGPCGPTTEIFVDGVEIWNLVFNEYFKNKDGNLQKLKSQGVDTGMGLERTAAIMQDKKDVFQTDIYLPIIKEINKLTSNNNLTDEGNRSKKIIADHVRGITFLAAENILPFNKQQGYVLRRLIRRAILHGYLLKINKGFLNNLIQIVILQLKNIYPQLAENKNKILENVGQEEEKFFKTLEYGLKEFNKIKNKAGSDKIISGSEIFKLQDTFGFPIELSQELAKKEGLQIEKESFEKALAKQKELSRGSQTFKQGSNNPKLHTTCHLLHRALRDVLGEQVSQAGQDITGDTLRFDFYYNQKVTEDQLKKIEDIVNTKIKVSLPVSSRTTTVAKAKKEGAIALFLDKYGKEVILYAIGDFSKELCAGPHVKNTRELGHFKIISEKSSASGVRRIKAQVG
jgi:alanyl-tRNA synthetase